MICWFELSSSVIMHSQYKSMIYNHMSFIASSTSAGHGKIKMYFLFDSNIVQSNSEKTVLFSSIPQIGHCAYLKEYSRNKISLFLAKRIIKDDWKIHENVYLAPKDKLK